jgi:hypothetical protein
MHDDDMVPNVRKGQKELPRDGYPKNLLEGRVGEVLLLAVRVCRLTAGCGGKEPTDVYVNGYDRKNGKEIQWMFLIPKAALLPVENDQVARDLISAAKEIDHLLPHPDDIKDKKVAAALRVFNRALLDL